MSKSNLKAYAFLVAMAQPERLETLPLKLKIYLCGICKSSSVHWNVNNIAAKKNIERELSVKKFPEYWV